MSDNILSQIVDYYIKSSDFNGLPFYNIINTDIKKLIDLIDQEKIESYSQYEFINPHIKAFEIKSSKEHQKELVFNKTDLVVFYPTKKHLLSLNLHDERPFTKMLLNGEPQLKILYFSIEIIERYFNNPKYLIRDSGYRGTISIKDEFYDEEDILDSEYIQDYGMAYKKDATSKERYVGVFLRDLSKLILEAQYRWRSFLLPDNDNYIVNYGFIKNLIYGEWVETVSIYDALLEEIVLINKMCNSMGIQPLFRNEIKPHGYNEPLHYRHIFLPTIKNYYDFLTVLEKLVVHNINSKTFLKVANLIRAVERKDENGREKGSLTMFQEWLRINIRTSEDPVALIIKPLRNIREERQIPAHELYENKHDVRLYEKQDELIQNTYAAVRAIRLFFANHPSNKGIETPEYLITGEKIVIY